MNMFKTKRDELLPVIEGLGVPGPTLMVRQVHHGNEEEMGWSFVDADEVTLPDVAFDDPRMEDREGSIVGIRGILREEKEGETKSWVVFLDADSITSVEVELFEVPAGAEDDEES
jgi:hypothetical protein